MKHLFLFSIVLGFAINDLQAVTWYTHCYQYTCPEGQKMVKPNNKMAGTIEGTHKCFDEKNNTYSNVVQTMDYDQCSSKPCNDLDVCQAYQAGQKQAQEECLDTIYSLNQEYYLGKNQSN